MKRFLPAVLLIFSLSTFAQTRAITDTGQEIILHSNGTYSYVDAEDIAAVNIPTNPRSFMKSDNASFLLKSKKMNIGFWLDPKLWSFGESKENPDAEYEVVLKGEDL